MLIGKLLFEVPAALAEDCGALLMELGAGAVEEQEIEGGARLVLHGEDVSSLAALIEPARAALALLGVTEEAGTLAIHLEEQESDWATAWTHYLQPELITERWAVVPLGNEAELPEGLGRIWIRPALAFGDGAHATTRLAAQAVERFCLAHPGARVLDVGTGTGVLAMVAALSGASRVVGSELDPVALNAARENAALNGLAERIQCVGAGEPIGGGFDLVVANLPPLVLKELAVELGEHGKSASELVLTGFLVEQAEELGALFTKLGLGVRERVDEADWALLALRATPR